MKPNELEKIINEAFENKQNISESSDKKILDAINETIKIKTPWDTLDTPINNNSGLKINTNGKIAVLIS